MSCLTPKPFYAILTPLVLASSPALAQEPPRMSQHGTVSQSITGVTIKVEYDRPTARGRDLRAGIIHWDELWTPGANWATTLEFDGEVELEGHRLSPGKYSLWMIARDDDWTVVVSGDDRVFHTQRPDPAQEALRFTTRPTEGPYVDALTFSFPEVGPSSTTLAWQWGNFFVPLHFEVDPWPVAALSPAEHGLYVGAYDLGRSELEVVTEDGRLGIVGLSWAEGGTIDLVPKGDHVFNYGLFMDGVLREIYNPEIDLVFVFDDGQVTGYEVQRDGETRRRATRVR